MTMRLTSVLAFLAAISTGPVAAGAQSARPEFNLALGPTFPVGDLADHTPTGYNVIGGVGFTPPGSDVGIRAEGLYNAFTARNNVVVCGPGAGCGLRPWISALTVDLTYGRLLPRDARRHREPTTVYVMGGLGIYSVHAPLDSVMTPGGTTGFSLRDRADAGWNVGGGIRFPLGSIAVYVEARVHTMTATGTRMVPLSVGLIF
jgi:hypothetical protein